MHWHAQERLPDLFAEVSTKTFPSFGIWHISCPAAGALLLQTVLDTL